jgi:hypothetical protein
MTITLQESLRGVFYAPFYVALAKDAYAAEGVDVRFISSPRPADAARNVMDGSADVCWGGPMRVMQAYHQIPGCDLVSFAEVVTRDPFVLVGREPRPGFTLRDLLGLRVATVSEVPTPWMCLQEDLRRAGIAPARLSRVIDGRWRTTSPHCAAGNSTWCRFSSPSFPSWLPTAVGTSGVPRWTVGRLPTRRSMPEEVSCRPDATNCDAWCGPFIARRNWWRPSAATRSPIPSHATSKMCRRRSWLHHVRRIIPIRLNIDTCPVSMPD